MRKHSNSVGSFDALPDSGFVSIDNAAQVFSISVSTMRRQIARGAMPPLVRLTEKRVGQNVGALREVRRRLLSVSGLSWTA